METSQPNKTYSFYRNLLPIASLFIIAVLFFGVGYLSGKEKQKSMPPTDISGTDTSTENIDFSSFWKVWRLIDEKSPEANKITAEQRMYGAISGLAQSLKDPYTQFFPPEENKQFNEIISGEFSGVGMEVGIKDKILTVISPLKNTPAFNAGVRPGDKILKIDEQTTENLSVDEAIKKIRGPVGTNVKITIFRQSEKTPRVINLTRQIISIPTIDTKNREDGIFVISLYNFSANSSKLFRDALREFILSGKTKLIIDLRGNPGGYLDSAVDISSWFLPMTDVVVSEDFGSKQNKEVYYSRGYNIFNDKLKLAILIDQGSASASEIVTGALMEHGKAIVVGEKSFGKGSVQEVVPVTANTSLKITIAKWLTPNGISISEHGITPQYEVSRTEKDIEKGTDPQLEKAIELLNQ